MSTQSRKPSGYRPKPITGIVLLVLVGLICAAFGGSSRSDVAQVMALRPLLALMLIPALYLFTLESTRGLRSLLGLLALFALWTFLQLIPLPPDIWRALPAREAIAELDDLAGLGDHWRPISLSPTSGWNALASLIVPAVGLLIAASGRASSRMLIYAILVLGLVDGVLGLMQIATASDVLYFYRITTDGAAVGLFANENHSAVFSAVAILVCGYLWSDRGFIKQNRWLAVALPAVYLILVLSVFSSGSRAGLLLGMAAVLVTLIIFGASSKHGAASPRKTKSRFQFLLRNRFVIPAALAGIVFATTSAFIVWGDMPALEALFREDALGGLRSGIFPTLQEMASTFWLFGSGIGSFAVAYNQFEPTMFLLPAYLNQAHNDWIQFLIESGLPGVLIFLGMIALLVVQMLRLRKHLGLLSRDVVFWTASGLVIGAASLVDYPLRAPLFQLVGVWLLASLALRVREPS